jgi:hypothetical protein
MEGNLVNRYTFARLAADPADASAWANVPEIRIHHYLWADNGYQPEVVIQAGYTPEALHIRFRTYEADPLVRYHKLNEPVYTDSCVEFFIQPTPETDLRYYNFEFNAAGAPIIGLGINRDRVRFTELDTAQFAVQTAVNLQDADRRTYWQLQFSIPAAFLQQEFPAFRLEPGRSFRGNFFKCGDETAAPHYGCWNKIEGDRVDFHQHEYFGTLVLA